ncbi:hypothetical protein JL722_13588 [Aureococcus anophagefferens]|nr:hypothetical protein JL722_13588 [Aureococcus anophagefferens]
MRSRFDAAAPYRAKLVLNILFVWLPGRPDGGARPRRPGGGQAEAAPAPPPRPPPPVGEARPPCCEPTALASVHGEALDILCVAVWASDGARSAVLRSLTRLSHQRLEAPFAFARALVKRSKSVPAAKAERLYEAYDPDDDDDDDDDEDSDDDAEVEIRGTLAHDPENGVDPRNGKMKGSLVAAKARSAKINAVAKALGGKATKHRIYELDEGILSWSMEKDDEERKHRKARSAWSSHALALGAMVERQREREAELAAALPPPPPAPVVVVRAPPGATAAADPAYAKFHKMLRMHVPRGAVEAKMAAEGLDPARLDDAPPPAAAAPVAAAAPRKKKRPSSASRPCSPRAPAEAAGAARRARGGRRGERPQAAKDDKPKEKKPKGPVLTHLVDGKRNQNVLIGLGRVKLSPRRRLAALGVDKLPSLGDASGAEIWLGLIPTDEETQLVTGWLTVNGGDARGRQGRGARRALAGDLAGVGAAAAVDALEIAGDLRKLEAALAKSVGAELEVSRKGGDGSAAKFVETFGPFYADATDKLKRAHDDYAETKALALGVKKKFGAGDEPTLRTAAARSRRSSRRARKAEAAEAHKKKLADLPPGEAPPPPPSDDLFNAFAASQNASADEMLANFQRGVAAEARRAVVVADDASSESGWSDSD